MSPPSRLSEQLLLVAEARLSEDKVRNEANLRRATSDLYYAVFHAICEALVEPLGRHPENKAFIEAYTKIYRQLDHGHAEKRCKKVLEEKSFSKEIQGLAEIFTTLKNKRESAD